jgi:hypothetical protein
LGGDDVSVCRQPIKLLFFQIVKRFDIIDATSFLLEKSGDVKGAFSLSLEVRIKILTLYNLVKRIYRLFLIAVCVFY